MDLMKMVDFILHEEEASILRKEKEINMLVPQIARSQKDYLNFKFDFFFFSIESSSLIFHARTLNKCRF
jgi:hypothetical protein